MELKEAYEACKGGKRIIGPGGEEAEIEDDGVYGVLRWKNDKVDVAVTAPNLSGWKIIEPEEVEDEK